MVRTERELPTRAIAQHFDLSVDVSILFYCDGCQRCCRVTAWM